MRNVFLFIAMSLDGYIADPHGKVDWLTGQDETAETEDTYSAFIKDVDTVIMGFKTYDQIVTELSPTEWIYSSLKSYVITHKTMISTEATTFSSENPCDLVKRIREESGKDIWICGGAAIVQQLMKENLIDRYYISVIPTILGGGIRLFGNMEKELKLQLIKTQTYNGITDLIYEPRPLAAGRKKAED